MESLYDDHEEYNKMWDELNSVMLSNPSESLPLCEMMQKTHRDVVKSVRYDCIEEKTHAVDLVSKDNIRRIQTSRGAARVLLRL
jgi:hypothetical protein